MNPAVSLAFAVTRRLPWRKLPVYIAGQMIGAFVASACVYGIYYGEKLGKDINEGLRKEIMKIVAKT